MGKKMYLSMGLVVMVAVAVLAMGAAALYGRSRKVPDRIEVVGPFEVVTHTSRHSTGWNEGHLGIRTAEHYSLRFRGRLFAFDGKAGMWGDQTSRYKTFNSIITFPSPEPAVVVNVGDPNNASFFYLVREEGGQAVARYLGESSGGVSAEWLDPPAAEVLEVKDIALHRGHMEGGRWLLLGEYTVLDTRSLFSYVLRPAAGFSPNNFKPVMAMSPAGGSFVRYGCSTDPSNLDMLAVFKIESGDSYSLYIDRTRMRFNLWEEIDTAWLDHHFEWKEGSDGHLRLSEREEFKPLPYHGRLRRDHGSREYSVKPVKPEMHDRFIAFLKSGYGAEIQPPVPNSPARTFLIDQRKINVMLFEDSLGIWMDLETDNQLVEEIAKNFDGVLATCELDGLFESVPPGHHPPPASATGGAGNLRATVVLSEDVAAFVDVWNRPTAAGQPPIWTINHVTVGKPVCAFVLFSGCARDAEGGASLKASFDVLRPDGSSVVTVADIPIWNAPAPPETHLQMAEQRWEIVFDGEERSGIYRIRSSVCDLIAENCVELSLPFEFMDIFP
ncbi:MAG: hypothetical protein GY842_26735 [bacterium]|nr:hypothetical protein [bacterium]